MSEEMSREDHAMRAMDVMTTNVITVAPDTSVQDLAALLVNHGISGVPVVDEANNLIGIVSEGDLLHRAEIGTEPRTERRRARCRTIIFGDTAASPIASSEPSHRNIIWDFGHSVLQSLGYPRDRK